MAQSINNERPAEATNSISDNAAEQLLVDLVTIESPSTQEHAASAYLVQWMAQHGYDDAFVDNVGNAVGIIGSGSRDILLLGHIDTFGGNPPVYIDQQPDGRTLYGRGSVDAKGSLCTFAVAARRAALPDDTRFIVIGAVEEEAASSKGARYVVQQYQPAACVIGEPSNWDRITLGYKGRLLLDWEWYGSLGHSAGQVTSPPEHAFAYWQRVQDYVQQVNAGEDRIFGQLDATLQDIHSEQDGAYGRARMTIGFRIPPAITPQQVAADLYDDSADVTLTARGHEHAYVCQRDSILSRAMRGAIRDHQGTPRFVYKTGTADMNVVGAIWDCPMLAYGPGDSALDHTPDEHLNLDEYRRAIAVLSDALGRI